MDLFQIPFFYLYEESFFKKRSYTSFLGSLDAQNAEARGMKVVVGNEEIGKGEKIRLFLLVDKEDGVIADVRFQLYASSVYYLVLETLAELILLKSYPRAQKVTSHMIEQRLCSGLKDPLPSPFFTAINHALFALDEALKGCRDIALDEKEFVTPLEEQSETEEVPNWLGLDLKTQLEILERIIATDIRPYIELDEGGVEIVSLKEGIYLTIGYKGACTSCHASTGSTLQAIQQILRAKVFPALVVIPDASWLTGSNSDASHE